MAVVVVFMMLFQVGAALRVLQTPDDMAARVSLPMPLEFIASAIWGLLAALVAVRLVRNTSGAARTASWLLVGFLGYSLARLFIFAQADYDRQRWPLLLITGLILLIPLVFILRPSRAATPLTENSGNGRKSED